MKYLYCIAILFVLVPHIVRCASGNCGDTGEGEDAIHNIYIFNTSTAGNIKLSFPDLLFSPFRNGPNNNSVCNREQQYAFPFFSLSEDDPTHFDFSCIVLDPDQLNSFFLLPIVINMGKQACNCTVTPPSQASYNGQNSSAVRYTTAVYISISANYSDGWIDHDWLYLGCSVKVESAVTHLQVNDTFKQVIIIQSYYQLGIYKVSYWEVVGIMVGGAFILVSITVLLVRWKKDADYFNSI